MQTTLNVPAKKTIQVAIGLLFHRGQVLAGWREEHLHQGGKYEFAGGKVEQGECAIQACHREILEEVGLDLHDWRALFVQKHEYDDVIVALHFFAHAVRQQQLPNILPKWQWFSRQQLLTLPFPKANTAILNALYWQPMIKISTQLSDLFTLDEQCLLYWRIDVHDVAQYASELQQFLAQHKNVDVTRLIINLALWQTLPQALQQQITTIHLKHHQLMALQHLPRAGVQRFIASCHDRASLAHAEQLMCDAVLCSPVLATATHPEATAIGWQTFAEWIDDYALPVFALGGMQRSDLSYAQQVGAYGIAGIREI